jgi:glycosyltransferase involved in cell wall biosynthesis/tetratricopeptide (TPR) repeat protein
MILDHAKKHREAVEAFQQGRAREALWKLDELLTEHESAEYWNDWGVVQLSSGAMDKAEAAFSRALQLDPGYLDATTNLGLLLLGKGESAAAKELFDRALPLLPPHQQKLVRALLESQPEQKVTHSAIQKHSSTSKWPLHILVIADAFPNPKTSGPNLHLMQLLRSMREQSHEVTLIARDGRNRNHYEPFLHDLGIRIFADDRERLAALGVETAAIESWSLHQVITQKPVHAAFLIQNFDHGFSVPEQYLDDIRRDSPATRIAILCAGLHCNRAAHPAGEGTKLQVREAWEDWSQRDWESLQRADLVVTPYDSDVSSIRDNRGEIKIAVATLPNDPSLSEGLFARQLAKTLAQIAELTPKPLFDEPFSAMQIEKLFAERLSAKTGENRLLKQLECYARMAGQLLYEGKPAAAHEQLRHIFSRTTGNIRADQFHAQVFVLLKRCYRELGNPEMAERCAAEARICAMREGGGLAPHPVFIRRRADSPALSVIVPTYNRLPILQKCLAALETQTLPAKEFEVIIIDDGSSDGTDEFLHQYAAPFRFQHLRQKNSGTGAARCNGVAHATGEYLLLMNDDTICDRDVAEQHLLVQQTYPKERWAVLGNFEYPAAARQRALTHYFRVEPFMFPQVSMEEGCPYGYSHFITCNLSVRRDAVVQAGSFDPTYKLSEDTELGLRLFERGFRVLYHPLAHSWHDHLPYPARNLVRRAKVYGADYFHMFRHHPRVMRDWAMPVELTAMDEENAARILGYVEHNRLEVEDALVAVERWDSVDFEPILMDQPETAALVLGLLRQAVPAIHWFYLFETMLDTMVRELNLVNLAAIRNSLHTVQAAASGV